MAAFEPLGDTRYETRFSWFAALGAGVWLLFLAPAVQEGWDERGALVGWVGLVDIVAFSAVYVWSFLWARPPRLSAELWRRVLPRRSASSPSCRSRCGMVLTVHSAAWAAVYVSVAGHAAAVLGACRSPSPAGAETLARTVPGWQGADGVALSVFLAVLRGARDLDGDAPQPRPRRREGGERPARDRPGAGSAGSRPARHPRPLPHRHRRQGRAGRPARRRQPGAGPRRDRRHPAPLA